MRFKFDNKDSNMRRMFFFLAVMILAHLPLSAQNDPDASVKALNYVIRNMNPIKGADRLVEDICKKFKNDPKVLVGIAESYYQAGDSSYAHKFFNRAIASDATYLPTYIAAGDWAKDRYGKNGYEEAIEWYGKAIKVNPKDSTGYIRYANILARQGKLDAAANKIKDILPYAPDFPVNLQIARIYSNAGKVNEAMEFYGKEKLDNLPPSDLREYATLCYLLGKNDVAIEAVKFGRQKFPQAHPIYRVGLLAFRKAENHKEAVEWGDQLITQFDESNLIIEDLYNLANSYYKLKKTNKAIELYQRVIDFPLKDASEEAKKNKQVMCNNAYQDIAQLYVDDGEWDKAYTTYKKYCDMREKEGRPSAYVYSLWARAYMYQAAEENGPKKEECYNQANRIYEKIAQDFPDQANVALENIINNCNRIDPRAERALAKPYAERLLALLNAKEKPLSENDTARYKLCNRYLGYYYYVSQNDKKTSIPYWRKVYEIDPNDKTARIVLGIKG